MVEYILFTLNQFSTDEQIVHSAVELLDQLSMGYSTGTMLSNLDMMQQLITSHSFDAFGFLKVSSLSREHAIFYAILARIVFRSAHVTVLFEMFVAPFENVLNTLDKSDLRTDASKKTGAQLCYAIKGMIHACTG
jgi:hypothetical protein